VSYLVLARKYRPSVFSSVSGQEHVTRTLANALKRDKVVHAYLFTGPRGVGKTSVSRILSKAINCQNPQDAEPCLECPTCLEIGAGTSLAVREIDGASHNSVENVRDLMDSFKSLPPPGYKRKIYIIDEVHMLSISAFNALLKSLEEPPPHTVFILATTDVHKIPETVISRCQRHDFRALSMATIEARLREVCEAEKIEADSESLKLVARMADGSMRDAQTLLDRVQSFCQGAITATETSRALGTVDQRILFELAQAIVARDTATVLGKASEIFATGIDPSTLLREFVHFWREVFVAKLGGENALVGLGLSKDASVELLRLVSSLEATDVQDLWDVARDGADRALRSAHPRYGFEALVARMATRQPVAEVGAIIGRLMGGGEDRKAGSPASARGGAPSASAQTAPPRSPAAPQAAVTAPSSVASTRGLVSAPTAGGTIAGSAGFAWEDIVAFASATTGRVLVENLKRLRPTRCEVGVFEAVGPEFTATSLMREKDKVIDIFNQYLDKQGTERPRAWKIVIQKGQGAVEVSVAEKAQAKAQGERELHGHPAVQSLQKIFPGSKVEQVRGKE
jgi:DNA polymerase-3 subunit gamma/tau